MPVEDPGRRVVEQGRLRVSLEERGRVVDEELVERVLARDEQREPTCPPPGASPLLPQRRDRPRETDGDRAVEQADVDAELERVGRGHAQQLALDEPPLDLASLLRRVPGAVRGKPPRGLRVESVAGEAMDELGRLPALREADHPEATADQPRQELARVAEWARARAQLRVEQLGVPEHHLALGARRRVRRDEPNVEPG